MQTAGDAHVDVLKIDIEGAELAVIDALLRDGSAPDVLCVEFDQPQPLHGIVQRVRAMQAHGYTFVKRENWNYTFVRGDAHS